MITLSEKKLIIALRPKIPEIVNLGMEILKINISMLNLVYMQNSRSILVFLNFLKILKYLKIAGSQGPVFLSILKIAGSRVQFF